MYTFTPFPAPHGAVGGPRVSKTARTPLLSGKPIGGFPRRPLLRLFDKSLKAFRSRVDGSQNDETGPLRALLLDRRSPKLGAISNYQTVSLGAWVNKA